MEKFKIKYLNKNSSLNNEIFTVIEFENEPLHYFILGKDSQLDGKVLRKYCVIQPSKDEIELYNKTLRKKHLERNNPKFELTTLIDTAVKQLSKLQVDLMINSDISANDYNDISEKVGELKELMINCNSYNRQS